MRSWLRYEEWSGWLCYYPGVDEYNKRDDYNKNSIAPKDNWESFPVNIEKEARSYESGVRRLERSYNADEIVSSDQQNHPDETITMYDDTDVSMELVQLPDLPSSRQPLTESQNVQVERTNFNIEERKMRFKNMIDEVERKISENDESVCHLKEILPILSTLHDSSLLLHENILHLHKFQKELKKKIEHLDTKFNNNFKYYTNRVQEAIQNN